MVILLAALATIATPASGAVVPQRQAQATVRIVPFAALRFAEIERRNPRSLRSVMLRAADGTAQPARLVEFE